MRMLLLFLTALSVIGSGYWAYHQNYETRDALKHTAQVQRDIAQARSRISMLEAEWAYLNRPERLETLVIASFDQLGLVEIGVGQFATVDQVPFRKVAPTVPGPVQDLPSESTSYQLASDISGAASDDRGRP